MNENNLLTISQIAKTLNVSRQTVYNRINSNPELSSKLCQCTVKVQKRTFYTLEAAELIKQEFEKSVKSSVDVKFTSNLIDTLTQQLTVKDCQIAALQSQVDKLTQTVQDLTIALKAAQALHGMEKKTKVIEIAEPERPAANVESRTVSAPRPAKRSRSATQQPSPSFFDFLKAKFRRKQ